METKVSKIVVSKEWIEKIQKIRKENEEGNVVFFGEIEQEANRLYVHEDKVIIPKQEVSENGEILIDIDLLYRDLPLSLWQFMREVGEGNLEHPIANLPGIELTKKQSLISLVYYTANHQGEMSFSIFKNGKFIEIIPWEIESEETLVFRRDILLEVLDRKLGTINGFRDDIDELMTHKVYEPQIYKEIVYATKDVSRIIEKVQKIDDRRHKLWPEKK
ncbi:hypothetical protein FACS189428_5410 [Clostridia bacterium]|nr:hypothetical protein FACS189428_5410 [Clostridia bacterium]